jgi:SAM-dependent methyltransferase
MTARMKHDTGRPCPLCGGNDFWPVSSCGTSSEVTAFHIEGYHWRLCKHCGNATPSHKVSREDLQAYWNGIRLNETEMKENSQIWDKRLADGFLFGRRTFDFLRPHLRTGQRKLLDVGCGLGATMAVFQEAGWEVHGFDPDPNVAPFHERLGLKTTIARAEEISFPDNMDIILVAHAIYFMEEPLEFLRQVRQKLAPDGCFVVLLTHLFSSLQPGRPGFVHTWYPTKASLCATFSREGFRLADSSSKHGSDLLLFKAAPPSRQSGHPRMALLAHKTQTLRYQTLGRIFRLAQKVVRAFKRFRSRAHR